MGVKYRKLVFVKAYWLVLLAGLLLSYLGYLLAIQLENRTIQVEHENLTNLAFDALKKELEINLIILSSIQGLFTVSPELSRENFRKFTASRIKDQPSIQALEWVPYVQASERENYRLKAVADGLLDFDFREQNAEGSMIPVREHWEYYPVYYVEPLVRNITALGFDLATSPDRMSTLQLAMLTRQTQATASISLIQEAEKQKGFLIFQPVFVPPDDTKTQNQEILFGFAVGVFRIGDLFKSAVAPIKSLLDPLMIKVIDITDLKNTALLHSMKSSPLLEPLSGWNWRYARDLQIANRTWRVTSIATTRFADQYANSTHHVVLGAGIIITLMITFYLRSLINRESSIRNLVNERTQQLVESEKMNRAIVENAVDAMITINSFGFVNLFSPAAQKMFGYSADEVIGQNIRMLMPEPYQSEHDGYLQDYQRTGKKRIIGIGREVTGQRKSGTTFPMHLSVGQARVNGASLFIGTVTDLTLHKQKENELKDFHDRLNLATRAGSIGVWDYDVLNRTLHWDKRMYKLYGVSQDKSPNTYKTWRNAMHPEDFQATKARLKQAIQDRKPFDTEFRIYWPDGQQRHISASGLVVFDAHNKTQRMIGVNLDITEQKKTEQAMLKARQTAEEANRQKSAFLNIMSHELRTPLTVILGYLPLLKNPQQMPPTEVIAQIASDMDISGNHLLEMINDLLDISKIEAGQMNLRLETTRCLPLMQDILRRFENQVEQKNIKLVSNTDDFEFKADTLRLRQIFINLIGNAVKFTPRGTITISARQDKEFVTFSVADTGIGIPQDQLPFIFETFHQVDDSSTRNVGGSGLGLAITKRLVELHGGKIQVNSIKDSGTTFTFSLKQ